MAVVTTNLGTITAYGDAVAAGYTGSKSDWQTLMASYATVATNAAESASAAATSATTASNAATTANSAKTAAQSAQTAAETAQGLAEDAKDDAEAAASSITASASQIATNTQAISSLNAELTELVQDSTATGIDLDVADPNGNVLVRFKNGEIQTKNFNSADINTYVTVKTDGTGDFTTLRAAIESITDADPDTKPYVIQIYPGTYNLTDEYTQTEIEEADIADYHDGFVGWTLTNGISLVGVGSRDAIILSCVLDTTTYNSTIRGNVSTLNLQGTVALENLTIIADHARYCVHDDFYYTESTQYTRTVTNCKLIGTNLAHSPACTYGGGMAGVGENAVFENVDFGTDYGHHFDASQSTHITFRHCRGRKIRLAERTGSNHHYVTIEDSDFDMISLMRPSSVTTQHIMVEANGCEKAYVSSYDNDIVVTGAITKTPITGMAVGTMVARSTTSGNQYIATSETALADGVIVANDDYYSYVQRTGYINTRILGMSGFSIGDYITIDANNALVTGGTSSNAVGQITFISDDSDSTDDGIGFIKMLIGGK